MGSFFFCKDLDFSECGLDLESKKSHQAKLLIHEVFNENQLESSEANDNSSHQFFRAPGGQKAGLGAKIHQH